MTIARVLIAAVCALAAGVAVEHAKAKGTCMSAACALHVDAGVARTP